MENDEIELIEKTKNMIDDLKAICSNYGLGNTGNEYKIISQVFLYKFLNDKFISSIRENNKEYYNLSTKEIEKKISNLEDSEYINLLMSLPADTAKFKATHLISYLFSKSNLNDSNVETGEREEEQFWQLFDNTLEDIADFNIDVFSVKTGGQEKIRLFEPLSINIVEVNRRNSFCKSIINKLVNFSFESAFKEKYDFFSTIFEYLIKDYNKDFGKYAEYYTPNSIARIIAHILVNTDKPQNVTIYDPAAGSGTLLLALAHKIGEDSCTLYTQDISQKSNEFLRLNLVLNNLVHSLNNVVHGDTLTNPAHYNKEKNRLAQFDYIVSNPPFNTDFSETRDTIASSKNKERFFAGVPKIPDKDKDGMAIYLCFIQHILYSLKEDGKCAIVVPTGFLTASNRSNKIAYAIRKEIVDNGWLKGIISMPSNIFATTGTNVSIIIIDKSNKNEKAVLIDASSLGEKYKDGKNQKTRLLPDEVKFIEDTFVNKNEEEDFSVIVSVDQLKEKNYSFSAGQYFDIKIDFIEMTENEFEEKMNNYSNNLKKYFEEGKNLEDEILKDLGGLKLE